MFYNCKMTGMTAPANSFVEIHEFTQSYDNWTPLITVKRPTGANKPFAVLGFVYEGIPNSQIGRVYVDEGIHIIKEAVGENLSIGDYVGTIANSFEVGKVDDEAMDGYNFGQFYVLDRFNQDSANYVVLRPSFRRPYKL